MFATGDDPDRFTAVVIVAATRSPIDTHPLALSRFELVVLNRVLLDRDRANIRPRPGHYGRRLGVPREVGLELFEGEFVFARPEIVIYAFRGV